MNKKEIEGLRELPLLKNFSAEGLVKFRSIFSPVAFKAGDMVFREGAEGDSLFIIAEGQVMIEKKRERVREKIKCLAIMSRGDFFGEMAVLEGQPRFAQARAAKDSLLYELSRERLYQFIRECPEDGAGLLIEIIRAILKRLRRVSAELLDAHGFMEVLVNYRKG